MTIDSSKVQVQLDPTGRIAQDVPCIHCGYNLRSLLPEQACPECNQSVAESLRGDLLRFSNPAWLGKLAGGMGWILVAGILSLACGPGMSLLLWPRLGMTWASALGAISTTIYLCIALMRLLGIWKATSPEPRLSDTQQGINVRTAARFVLIGAIAFGWMVGPLRSISGLQPAVLSWISHTIYTAGWVCLYIHLAQLGRRLPAPGLVRFTWVVCVIEVLANCFSLFIHIVSLWMAAGTGNTRTSSFVKWAWAFAIWYLVATASSILPLVLAGIYRRRFRKALRLSQQAMHETSAAGGTSA